MTISLVRQRSYSRFLSANSRMSRRIPSRDPIVERKEEINLRDDGIIKRPPRGNLFQLVLQSAGAGPSVLQQLCTLPFPFYGDPRLIPYTLPALLAATHHNSEAMAILSCELSYQVSGQNSRHIAHKSIDTYFILTDITSRIC